MIPTHVPVDLDLLYLEALARLYLGTHVPVGTMRDMCILCRSTVAGRNYSASLVYMCRHRPVYYTCKSYMYVASYVASLYSYYVGIPAAIAL